MHNSRLDPFFHAGSIAVIGVSPRPGNLGQRIVRNLHTFGYGGVIYPVGRRGGNFLGHRIHESVLDIDRPIELGVVFTPAEFVPAMMDECGRAGIRHVIIESGGFAELDEGGAALAGRVREIAEKYGIRFIGPNGIGTFNPRSGLCVSFSHMPPNHPGGISIVTQSGGVGITYLSEFAGEHLGVAKFASIGNKMNVDETDLLEYLKDDPDTTQIVFYLESFARGREFCRLVGETDKPVIVHKSNTSALSQNIAASHTTAMLSDDHVVEEALRQMGVLRTRTIHGAINGAKIFSLPPLRGTGIGVLSRSGGHAVIASDTCAQHGFTLPPFDRKVLEIVNEHVRAGVIRLQNPLDLGDMFEMDTYRAIMADILNQPQIDGVVFLLAYFALQNPKESLDLLDFIEEQGRRHGKPVALVVHAWPEEIVRVKTHSDFPIFETAEEAVDALHVSLAHYRRADRRHEPLPRVKVRRDDARGILAASRGRPHLGYAAYEVCRAYGLPVAETVYARTAAEAAAASKPHFAVSHGAHPGAVVLKIESLQAVHKTDVGGVVLKLRTAAEVKAAFARIRDALTSHMPEAEFDGVLVQPMAAPGPELIVGAARDKDFGPLVTIGWGGIAAEALGAPITRLAPVSRNEAMRMIDKLPARKVLDGLRGRPPLDVPALADIIVRAGALIAEQDELVEMDLNPVRVYERGRGALVLDARLIPRGMKEEE